MKKFKYLLLLFVTVNLSCENFLNVNPEGEVVNDELFKNEEGFQDAIYGVYSQLAGDKFYGKNMSYYLNDILAQYFHHDYTNDVTLKINTFKYKDQAVRPTIDNIWNGMYKNISYVNNILENLEKKGKNDLKLYDIYKGECLGMRAFMHFEILRLFSESIIQNANAKGIPYYEKYSFEVSTFLNAQESYKKIIADLEAAEKLLAEDKTYFSDLSTNQNEFLKDRIIHMNLYAIQATLARVYWTKGDLKTASTYAEKVLQSGYFSLADKTEIENLMNGVLSPKETVFGLFSANLFTTVKNDLYYTGNSNCLQLKPEHESMYMLDKEGTDFRYEKWFKNYTSIEANGLRCVKILDTYELTYRERPDYRVKGINMIRVPELYYIIAEYYLSINDTKSATEYFDKVMISRGLTPFIERQGETLNLQHIIHERRKELICEGQYFHSLKKYNLDIFEPKTGQTFKASNEIYVFPIPENETEYRN